MTKTTFEFDPTTGLITIIQDDGMTGGRQTASLEFLYDILSLRPGTFIESLGPNEQGSPHFRYMTTRTFDSLAGLPKEDK